MPAVHNAVAFFAATLVSAAAHAQTQVTKPPISTYGVDVETRTMSIPGMPSGGGGLAGMMMPGGMGGGPQKSLWLGLRSSHKASGAPEAQHQIPPGMAMGPALPLLAPPPTTRGETYDDEKLPEKPKARMLIYWGCGDAIRAGQPRVADTEKMTMEEFGRALTSRSPPDRWSALRNAQFRWPNEREPRVVPANASLRGEQLVKGSATPDIRFAIGEKQDFMAPFEITARGDKSGPTALSWAAVPTAQGYFLQAMGFRQSGSEMIIWTSSEVQDAGWGLMTFLPNDFLRRMISEKVVLPASTSTCTIPKGIFDAVEGAMVNGIAYGEEQNLAQPPRPADPKIAWDPIWAVKVRVKSTGMVPLGMEDMEDARASRRGTDRAPRASTQSAPREEKAPNPMDDATDAVNKLKGMFKF